MPHTRNDETLVQAEAVARDLADKLITFMETGVPPEGAFTADVFCDFTMPQRRLQAQGIEDVTALRKAGQPGRRFSSAHERARVAVRKAIVAALNRIAERNEVLARQLRDSVRTGGACRYDPDPGRPVDWILDD